jgi:probable O-glycosylation ligase (exosortase A-associated)
MRDALIALVLLSLAAVAFWRPWLMTFAYLYADLVQPQRLSYFLIQSIPVNFILGAAAVVLFIFDKKKNLRIGGIQVLMILFTIWFTLTSNWALIKDGQVWFKWDAAWKSVLFAGVFMPMVLSTRRRIEAVVCLLALCVGLVTMSGGLKTALGGGGYETLNLIVRVNRGLYESSTISTVGMAVVPLLIYLYRHSPLVGRTLWTRLIMLFLIACSVLVAIGVEARTGVVTGGMLALLLFLRAKRKALIVGGAVAAALVAIPFLPQTFVERASTITRPDEDTSTGARLEVWKWTWKFVQEHPFGGGFRVFRLNNIEITVAQRDAEGNIYGYRTQQQRGRAFHSSYFEVLGEHGFPGLLLYLSIIFFSLVGLFRLRNCYRQGPPEKAWASELADALIMAVIIYSVGGLFVGLAFQTTLYIFLGLGIALRQLMATEAAAERRAAAPERLRARLGLPPEPLGGAVPQPAQ